ncbi:MAG: abortive infection family protein [Dissulfurispiraceae bacterium]
MGSPLGDKDRDELIHNASRLLLARGQPRASEIFRAYPFQIRDAFNDFNDDFSVLYAEVPLEQYEQLRASMTNSVEREAFSQIASTVTEIGRYIRFIAAELKLEPIAPTVPSGKEGLKKSEILKVVNNWIGVQGGYLGDFSYRTHQEFYIGLDLDINTDRYDGTTRQRFIAILSESSPGVQARILQGVLAKYKVGSSELRTMEMQGEIVGWIERLRSTSPIPSPSPTITSEVVDRALADAENLIRTSGATSGVDRAHTALHGYLLEICGREEITIKAGASITELFKLIREGHPKFRDMGPRSEDIMRILKSMGSIIDAMNPIRNMASVAHPNTELLQEQEAMLVINIARTILHYVDSKLGT